MQARVHPSQEASLREGCTTLLKRAILLISLIIISAIAAGLYMLEGPEEQRQDTIQDRETPFTYTEDATTPNQTTEETVAEGVQTTYTQTTQTATTDNNTNTETQEAERGLPPGFELIPTTNPIALLPGGEAQASVRLEAFGGFEGTVELEVVGFRYKAYNTPFDWLASWDRFFEVDITPQSIAPGEEATITVRVVGGQPPGGYLMVVKATSSEGLTTITNIPVYIAKSPGYIIVPNPPPEPVKPLEPFTIEIQVIPVGGFEKEVELKFKRYGYLEVLEIQSQKGVPPFTATVKLQIVEYRTVCSEDGKCTQEPIDPWWWFGKDSRYEPTNTSTTLLQVWGTGGYSTAYIVFGTEKIPDRGNPLLALLKIFLLPFNIVLSLVVGTIVGAVNIAAMPTMPINSVVAAVEAGSLVLSQPFNAPIDTPEAGGFAGESWLGASFIGDGGGYLNVVKVAVVGEFKKGSILVSSSKSVGGIFLINAVAPGEGDVYLEVVKASKRAGTPNLEILSKEPGRIVALLKISPSLGKHEIRLVSADGRVLDVVEVDSPPYTINYPVVGRPGETIVLKLPYYYTPPGYTVEELQVMRHIPWLRDYGQKPLVVYSTGYIKEYWYRKPYEHKQGEEFVEHPEAGVKPASILLESYSVYNVDQNTTIIILKLSENAPPGLYEIYGLSLLVLVPQDLDMESLTPQRVKEWRETE